MHHYLDYWIVHLATKGPVAVGALILMASVVPARKLARRLPSGRMRLKWNILTALIVFSIACYGTYIYLDHEVRGDLTELVVPAVFFLSACFVHTVTCISLQADEDMHRLSTLEIENVTDPLMGIFNRRYLDRRLKEEVERASRLNQPLGILLVDLDHFKSINDTYGHQSGDRVLEALGRLLVDSLRQTDVLSRYGGEEVLIIAPNTTMALTVLLGERLRKEVESSLRVVSKGKGGQREIRVTASIGVSELGEGEIDVDALVERADRALYRAKQEGRNRVVACPPHELDSHNHGLAPGQIGQVGTVQF